VVDPIMSRDYGIVKPTTLLVLASDNKSVRAWKDSRF
jgi:hypothetical protein